MESAQAAAERAAEWATSAARASLRAGSEQAAGSEAHQSKGCLELLAQMEAEHADQHEREQEQWRERANAMREAEKKDKKSVGHKESKTQLLAL